MLIDLQPLDVDVCHAESKRGDDDQQAKGSLGCKIAAEAAADDHQCADVAHKDEQDDEVAVDPVEWHGGVPNGWDELPDH